MHTVTKSRGVTDYFTNDLNGTGKMDTVDYFELDEDFLAKYEGKKPNFGYNGLGELVFYRTYSRLKPDGSKESPLETFARVVEGCFEIQRRYCHKMHISWTFSKAQKSAQEMFERMWLFKFLPPGRGLWAMGTDFMWGRGSAALNNCFRATENIITRDGIKPIGDLVGTTQQVLTIGGKWVDAPIRSFGEQRLWKLTVTRVGVDKHIYTTADHRWFAKSSRRVDVSEERSELLQDTSLRLKQMKGGTKYKTVVTADLKIGMKLRSVFGQGIKGNVRPSVFGIAHGICFGDGTKGHPSDGASSYIYLCGKKNIELLKYFGPSYTSFDESKGKEGAIRVADIPRFFKDPPRYAESKSYLYGWLAGYFAADGHMSKRSGGATITSSKIENLEAVRDVCSILGINASPIRISTKQLRSGGEIKEFVSYTVALYPYHLPREFFLISHHKDAFDRLIRKSAFRNSMPNIIQWRVKSIEETDLVEEVFCPQVPDYHAFALEGNILTGNCAFVSTSDIIDDFADPFCFNMDMSMIGVGVGFDTKGAGVLRLCEPGNSIDLYVIPDSREGWVESLRALLLSYQTGLSTVAYDFSHIRPEGSDIKGFGGKASGPGILKAMLEEIRCVLDSIVARSNRVVTSVDILDIMDLIGKCVVAGNVRRTALLALGDRNDNEYYNAKNYLDGMTKDEIDRFNKVTEDAYANHKYQLTMKDFVGVDIDQSILIRSINTWNSCNNHRWASNNSIFAEVGMDYTDCASRTAINGEPGYVWMDNVRNYGRLTDGRQPGIDGRAVGVNPCGEQALESYELCTLCETFPIKHDDVEDYHRTLKFAYLYSKTVTLLPTHNMRTNSVMLRNRRIGLSQSGIIEAFKKFGRRTVLRDFCDKGYKEVRKWDSIYSDWLCCPKSIKVTTVKPSGSVSLVAGTLAGIHYSIAPSRYYWRRVRIASNSTLVNILKDAGYDVVPAISDPDRTVVVKFGISAPDIETVGEISMWEQVKNSVDYQRYWSDNNVSVTVQFGDHEANQIADVLEAFETDLKSISFLPLKDHGYIQAPYESATEDEVNDYNNKLENLDFSDYINEDAIPEKYCDGDVCKVY